MKSGVCVSLLFILVSAIYAPSCAQTFVEALGDYEINHSYSGSYLGGGCSTFDFNQDGLDDITLSGTDGGHKLYLNTSNGFIPQDYLDITTDVKSIIWIDYDNDGDNDISLTEYQGLFRVFENDGAFNFTEVELNIADNTPTYNSGISWGDYDSDGFLDAYITRYPEISTDYTEEKTNLLIKNNGGISFTDVTDDLDVGNGYQHSFISTWLDIDNDNDLDLYVVNDRHLFENATYINNGNGTFTEMTSLNGANLEILAMTSTVDDYDNDGDYDIYCTNTTSGNHLLTNSGYGSFTDQFPYSGAELYRFSWGANWIDFNNNGLKDLFVAVGEFNLDNSNSFFINSGNGVLTSSNMVLDNISNDSHGVSKGDFNGDGLYDLVINNEYPSFSRVLLNTSNNANNSFKLCLEGTYSNKNAIGSQIKVYIGDHCQHYFTKAGSDYISQDSQNMIIGLGQSMAADSVQITWPRGVKETFYNLEAGESYQLKELENFHPLISTSVDSICPGESAVLSVDQSFDSILWSDGNTDFNNSVNLYGDYFASIQLINGITIPTDTITISESASILDVDISISHNLCFNDSSATVIFSGNYNNETFTIELDSLAAGNYTEVITIENSCPAIMNYQISSPPDLISLTNIDQVTCNELGEISAIPLGGTAPYEVWLNSGTNFQNLNVGEYFLEIIDANGCQYSETLIINELPLIDYNLEVINQIDDEPGSVNIITENDINNLIINDSAGNGADQTGLSSGNYTIEFTDENGCQYSEDLYIDQINGLHNISDPYSDFIVYPNPAYNSFNIETQKEISHIRLFDFTGKTLSPNVLEQKINSHFSQLSSGTYLLKVQFKDGSEIIRKIIKT